MTNKERLNEIKARFSAMNELESFKKLAPTELFFEDINYLIKQAERTEKLEKENHKLNFEIGSYAGQVGEIAHSIGVNIADLKILATRMCKGGEESQ